MDIGGNEEMVDCVEESEVKDTEVEQGRMECVGRPVSGVYREEVY